MLYMVEHSCFATMVCSACKSTRYCSRDHQRLHWKIHKTVCRPSEKSSASTASTLSEPPSWSPPVFPELSIEVADELGEEDGDHDDDSKDESKKPQIWEDAGKVISPDYFNLLSLLMFFVSQSLQAEKTKKQMRV